MVLKFSVIIPTYRRHEALFQCLQALSHHFAIKGRHCEFDIEVIVSDDAREADLRDLLGDRFPWCRYVEGPARGPAANRNNGAQHARGDWIAFTDDDCVPSTHWLDGIYRYAQQVGEVDVVEGRTEIPNKVASPFLHGVENLDGGCLWSCNLAIKREVFLKIGGFDEDFLEAGGEDMELAWRIRQLELRTVFETSALVFHPQRRYSLKQFLNRVPLLRWSILFRIKTNSDHFENENSVLGLLKLFIRHIIETAKRSVRLSFGFTDETGSNRWFNAIWPWLVMPYQLPYLLYWQGRFLNEFRAGRIRRPLSPGNELYSVLLSEGIVKGDA